MGITRNLAFTPSETDLCLVALLAVRTGKPVRFAKPQCSHLKNRSDGADDNTSL